MMDYERSQQLAKEFSLDVEDLMWAMQETIRHLQEYPSGKRRSSYRNCIEPATQLMREWLSLGHTWVVDIHDPVDVCRFIRSRCAGCAWCVMQSKIKAEEAS